MFSGEFFHCFLHNNKLNWLLITILSFLQRFCDIERAVEFIMIPLLPTTMLSDDAIDKLQIFKILSFNFRWLLTFLNIYSYNKSLLSIRRLAQSLLRNKQTNGDRKKYSPLNSVKSSELYTDEYCIYMKNWIWVKWIMKILSYPFHKVNLSISIDMATRSIYSSRYFIYWSTSEWFNQIRSR